MQVATPNDQKPKRLETSPEPEASTLNTVEIGSIDAATETKNQPPDLQEQFKQIWSTIQYGAAIPGRGDRVKASFLLKHNITD